MMDKTAEIQKKIVSNYKKFTPLDLPKIKKMVKQIKLGLISQQKTADRFGVARHQIRKWVMILQKEDFSTDADTELKQKIVQEIVEGKISVRQASFRYEFSLGVITRWLKGSIAFANTRTSTTLKANDEVEDELKIGIVRKIQDGELSIHKAAAQLKINRYHIRKWISNYSMFNLDGSVSYHMLATMNPEEQNKELLDQIEQLKKQLEKEKLKAEALETLIQVAEEKFGIKIKKKPGSKQ
jgi:transposase-like protein